LIWGSAKRLILLVAYAPVAYFGLRVYAMLATAQQFNVLVPGSSLGRAYGIWLILALVCGGGWQRSFAKYAPRKLEARFHWFAFAVLCAAGALVYEVHFHSGQISSRGPLIAETALALTSILPLAILIYLVQRHDFLQFGRQKNLVYAVTVTFLALLYLSLVRRVSNWLEPIFPPEASGAILLFVLVVFFEPMQRMLGRRLQQTAQREIDRVQKLAALIQQEARQGNRVALVRFVEEKVKQEFELESVQLGFVDHSTATLRLNQRTTQEQEEPEAQRRSNPVFALRRNGELFGFIRVRPHGSAVSGEIIAALEFLSEQLPAALDMCQLIEEKLQLERELAERERLALVGQTAASISHNLKNPLGSIKTILQVQLENPEMPESMRGETKMVLDEISRLSAKLNQLLQFSRPAVRGSQDSSCCDADAAVLEVVSVLRPEADRRGVSLHFQGPASAVLVAISAEALNDILSNLIVNALEATPSGGKVIASLRLLDLHCEVAVEDDGPGIPIAAQEKVLQPFFTTKSQGTGLGLAIVARRVSESFGKLEFQSPIAEGKGTRFRVSLPLAARPSLNA
jgi:signal transduction histidine kinase